MARTRVIDDEFTNDIDTPIPVASRWGVWAWTAIACVLLGASGVVRAVQDRRHQDESRYLEASPFPLRSLPRTMGVWKMAGGEEQRLDDLTMRITGGTDYCMRTYIDELTGVSLLVLVLFGPAEPVLPHTPDVCFPTSGFAPVDPPSDRLVNLEDGKSALFRTAVYAKAGGRAMLREEVYHSFRLEGTWSPYAGSGRKFARRNPSVFKVQVQRRVAEGERRDRDDPIEQFLAVLIPEIERQIGGIRPAGVPGPSAQPATPKVSMGGVGSSPTGGGVRRDLVGRVGGGAAIPGEVGGRSVSASAVAAGEPLDRVHEGGGAADQADRQDHRGQVDGQGDVDRDAERVDLGPQQIPRSPIRVAGLGDVR